MLYYIVLLYPVIIGVIWRYTLLYILHYILVYYTVVYYTMLYYTLIHSPTLSVAILAQAFLAQGPLGQACIERSTLYQVLFRSWRLGLMPPAIG